GASRKQVRGGWPETAQPARAARMLLGALVRAAVARMTIRTRTPTPTHTAWRARRTSVNASPALAPRPRLRKAAAFAPSSGPRLAGTKKVANRTDDQRASRIVATTIDAGNARLTSTRNVSTIPSSQPTR